MTDYIRKGVELADGWSMQRNFVITPIEDIDLFHVDSLPQMQIDALAAQLVRQVDELPAMSFEIFQTWSRLTLLDAQAMPREEFYGRDSDRTLNTIKAIVDSGVLDD